MRATYGTLAAAMFLMMAGANLPTSFYRSFTNSYDLSPTKLSALYSIYAVVVMVCLPYPGRLSDQIGRKPIIFAGIVCASAGTLTFALADGLPALFLARSVQGVGIGLASGAVTAALAETQPTGDRSRAALTATLASAFGGGIGPFLGGLMATVLPEHDRLAFLVHAAATAALALLLLTMPFPVCFRTSPTTPLAHENQEPIFAWSSVLAACGVAALAFSVPGVFLSLGPVLVADVMHTASPAVGGYIALGLLGCSAAAQMLGRSLPPLHALLLGLLALSASVCLLAGALSMGSWSSLAVASVLGGSGHGLAFLGSVTLVNRVAPPGRRGFVTSILYVAIYFGGSIPVLAFGALAGVLEAVPATGVFALSAGLAAATLALLNLGVSRRSTAAVWAHVSQERAR